MKRLKFFILFSMALFSTYPCFGKEGIKKTIYEMQSELGYIDSELRELNREVSELKGLKDGIGSIIDLITSYSPSEEFSDASSALSQVHTNYKEDRNRIGPVELEAVLRRIRNAWRNDLRAFESYVKQADSELKTFRSPFVGSIRDKINLNYQKTRNEFDAKYDKLYVELIKKDGRDEVETSKAFSNLIKACSEVSMERYVLSVLDGVKNRIDSKVSTLKKQIDEKTPTLKSLARELENRQQGQTQIDKALVTFALPSFAVLIVLLLLAPRLYKDTGIQKIILESGVLLELITVFLLTATTLLLGIANKIDGDILGTLLGGISGYVLGRSRTAAKIPSDGVKDTSK